MRDDRVMESTGISADGSIPRVTRLSSIKRWLREPLVHFLLIGLVLFAVYGVLNPGPGQGGSLNQIVLNEGDLQQLQIGFISQWQRPPSPQQPATPRNT